MFDLEEGGERPVSLGHDRLHWVLTVQNTTSGEAMAATGWLYDENVDEIRTRVNDYEASWTTQTEAPTRNRS